MQSSSNYHLVAAVMPEIDWRLEDLSNPNRLTEVTVQQVHYSSAEIGVYGRTYRTWLLSGMDQEEHVMHAILALIDLNQADAELVRSDLTRG